MYNIETDIVLDNLRELKVNRVSTTEKTAAHIGELALLMCDSASDDEIFFRDNEFIETYRKITAYGIVPITGGISGGVVEKTEKSFSAFEKALLCKKITENMGIVGIEGIETYTDDDYFTENTSVCYLRSAYSDTAFINFSEHFENLRAIYCDSFQDVCRNVATDICGFCILPTASTNDGRLTGFNNLVNKYELKKVMTCRVKTAEEEYTEFTLFKKNIVPPTDLSYLFELKISTDGLSDFLEVASLCGLKPFSVYSSTDGCGEYDIVFEMTTDSICGFLSYLYLEYDNFTIIGFYKRI